MKLKPGQSVIAGLREAQTQVECLICKNKIIKKKVTTFLSTDGPEEVPGVSTNMPSLPSPSL